MATSGRHAGEAPGGTTPRHGREILIGALEPLVAAPAGRPAIDVIAPFTGAVLGRVPACSAEDVRAAAHRARAAQRDWARRGFSARGRVLLRFHDLLLARQDEILDVIQLESGKARRDAFEEVLDTAIVARYYARTARRHLRPRRRRGALPVLTATWEHHHPLGVVGFIAPWNYPLTLGITDAIAAIAAGNGAVIKPDRQTPFATLWAVSLLREAGMPADLVQVVTGSGADLGGPLIDAVDFVMFTGSTATGRVVATQAAQRLIGSSMELGGKNAMIVLADADLERAVEGAGRACFSNTGQLCISIERLYVQRPVYDDFVARFAARTGTMTMGPNLDYSVDVGSLASRRQLEAVQAHVDEAVAAGARVLAGGRHRPELGPFFFEPTILSGVTPAMRVCAEETFGPVVSVYPFDTVDEVVAAANASPYGLNFSVWTKRTHEGRRLASRLAAGTVNVNDGYAATWASVDAPMGGFKDSGLGRRHGAAGILKYTEPQTVAVQRLLPIAPPRGVSQAAFARVMTAALRMLRRLPGVR